MMLGTDVSSLSTTAATAAAQGLSIVVPLYNEAAGLRRCTSGFATSPKPSTINTGCAAKSSMSTTAVPMPRSPSRAGLQADAPRHPGRFAVAQFRQGSRADGRPRSCAARRGPVHGRRRPASAGPGRKTGRPLDRWRLRRRLYGESQSRQRIVAAAAVGARLLRADQLGRPAENPGRRRRLPPAVATRSRCLAAASGAQPLLQGAGELDRLSPDPRRL